MDVLPYTWKAGDATHAHRFITEPILASLPDGNSLRVADLGCGNGYLAGVVAGLGHEVCGLDSSAEGIRLAKEHHPQLQFHCLSLYDDLKAHLGDEFDAVISSEVIEHLYDPRKFLKNAYALLRPGGRLILSTPYHGYLKNLVLAVSGRLDRHFTVDWDCGHIKFYSVRTLGMMVEEQGFRKVSFRFSGRVPYLWRSMILQAER